MAKSGIYALIPPPPPGSRSDLKNAPRYDLIGRVDILFETFSMLFFKISTR
jgi:hypothetical protein